MNKHDVCLRQQSNQQDDLISMRYAESLFVGKAGFFRLRDNYRKDYTHGMLCGYYESRRGEHFGHCVISELGLWLSWRFGQHSLKRG